MGAIRYLEKLTSEDGLLSYTFPVDDYEHEAEQRYREASEAIIGADYAHDFGGVQPWAKDVGNEAVRFTIWGTSEADAETQFDTCAGTLRRIGRGKLYALASDGSRRWAWAKLAARPSYSARVDDFYNVAVALRFRRYSDWFASAATTGTQAVAATPATFTVNNPGNAPVLAAVFRLRSSGATGFTNPSLTNLTNGYSIASTRDAVSANSELRIDAGAARVQWSDDDGASYADDYALATLGATQAGVMRLEPGDNTMRYTDGGTPNLSIEWSFYAAYE